MSAGILCGIVYILINLSALPQSFVHLSGMLLYVSIVALASGLLFYMMARTADVSLTESTLGTRGRRDG
jgi:uncharacterized MnhB-related membrane protein